MDLFKEFDCIPCQLLMILLEASDFCEFTLTLIFSYLKYLKKLNMVNLNKG